MEELTVDIPDNILTEKQIELVNDARKQLKEDPDSFLDWDEARKTLNVE